MLFATSCETDADVTLKAGKTSVVTFSVGTPEIVSRAYSDGLTATVLQYAVYDEDGEYLDALTVTNGEIYGSTTVNLKLTTGKEYSVIFWAAAPNAPYTVDFANKTMKVNYENAACNDENRDAFYKYHTFTVNGTQTEIIELKRPFAQLNIGTADYAASASAGYTPTQSAVTVKNIYNTLDLATGAVSNEVEAVFAEAAIPTTETFPVADNEYLAMNYLLVADKKELVEVEFIYTDGTNAKTRKVGSVPVQRNYRTNLYGKLLTSEVDINVEIKPDYGDEFDNEGFYVETGADGNVTAVVESANGLATIAAKINEGKLPSNTNVALEGHIDLADFAEVMRSGAVVSNWTPIGTGSENPFTGTFDGKGYTIKNFSYIVTGEEEAWYVGIFGFAKDVTIKNLVMENVTIYSENAYFAEVGAVVGHLEGTSTLENITIKGDVKIEGNVNHGEVSRIGAVVGGNYNGKITVKNVHVNATEGSYVKGNSHIGGIAGQLQEANTFENCSSNIDVTAGKFFAGGIIGCAGQYDTYTNCHTTGDIAVVAGRAGNANDLYRVGGIAGGWSDDPALVLTVNKCSYTGTVSGKDAEGTEAEAFDCFGYVGRGYGAKVGSTVVIDGNVFVYSGNGIYTINGLTPVATADELVAALNEGKGAYLMNDINMNGVTTGFTVAKDKTATLNLNGHNIIATSTSTESVQLFSVAGTLDVIGNGTISLTSDNFPWNSSYRYAAINIRETGVVTLGEGVKVICEASKDDANGMSFAVDIYHEGVLNVNGASLHSNYIAVRGFYGAPVVNVNSGSKITSSKNNYGIWLQSTDGAQVNIAEGIAYTIEDDYGIYIFG